MALPASGARENSPTAADEGFPFRAVPRALPDGEHLTYLALVPGNRGTTLFLRRPADAMPVPLGPVTVAMFMRNATAAHEKQLAAGWLR